MVQRGAGELLLTDIEQDGSEGTEFRTNKRVKGAVTVPVIASGGVVWHALLKATKQVLMR